MAVSTLEGGGFDWGGENDKAITDQALAFLGLGKLATHSTGFESAYTGTDGSRLSMRLVLPLGGIAGLRSPDGRMNLG